MQHNSSISTQISQARDAANSIDIDDFKERLESINKLINGSGDNE